METPEPPAKPTSAPHAPELVKGNCQDCPYYKDCPRMRGENVCHNLHPAPGPPAAVRRLPSLRRPQVSWEKGRG